MGYFRIRVFWRWTNWFCKCFQTCIGWQALGNHKMSQMMISPLLTWCTLNSYTTCNWYYYLVGKKGPEGFHWLVCVHGLWFILFASHNEFFSSMWVFDIRQTIGGRVSHLLLWTLTPCLYILVARLGPYNFHSASHMCSWVVPLGPHASVSVLRCFLEHELNEVSVANFPLFFSPLLSYNSLSALCCFCEILICFINFISAYSIQNRYLIFTTKNA